MRRAIVGCWVALVTTAYAQPHGDAGLAWRVPDGCPDAAEARARIERRLGTPIDQAVQGIAVEVASEGEGAGRRFVARIDLRAVTVANEIRVLSSARCAELTDAVAVVIARVAVEHRRSLAVSAPRERPFEVRARSRMEPAVWGGGLRTIGVSGIGALPGVGRAAQVAGYARYRSLLLELGATRWDHGQHVLREGAPGRVDVGLDLAALRVGWGPAEIPLRAWAAGELGVIEGRGVALVRSEVGRGRWMAVGAGFGVAWPMTAHTRLFGMVEMIAPLARTRFLLQDGTEVYRSGPANARCGLGLEIGWR